MKNIGRARERDSRGSLACPPPLALTLFFWAGGGGGGGTIFFHASATQATTNLTRIVGPGTLFNSAKIFVFNQLKCKLTRGSNGNFPEQNGQPS